MATISWLQKMGLDPVCHGPPDPSPLHHAWATYLYPKVTAFAIQTSDGTMGASAHVLDEESQQTHHRLEGYMATKAGTPL